jgi:hypothetical protein
LYLAENSTNDLENWTIINDGNAILSHGSGFESERVTYACLLKDLDQNIVVYDDKFWMLYTGMDASRNMAMGMAYRDSSLGINGSFTKDGGNPIDEFQPDTFHNPVFISWNYYPLMSDESPVDNSINQSYNPVLSIQVNDTNHNDNLNVTFRTNASGSWSNIGFNSSVGNGTYSQDPSDMSSDDTTYYWSVNLTDGVFWNNQSFSFTTNPPDDTITVSNPYPSNGSTGINRQPWFNITIVNSLSNVMNISWYWGTTLGDENTFLETDSNIGDGSVTCIFTNATGFNTEYFWRIQVDDGTYWENNTFSFTTIGQGGGGGSNSGTSTSMVIAVGSVFLLFGFVLFRRKH